MKNKIIFFISILLAVLCAYNTAFCFDQRKFILDFLYYKTINLPKEKRPKIILVLGGGGARGFAHIGVLKVLKEI